MTQFGRMCDKLGIRIIAASSPQAKGRVERAHGTHQDRLVKKLRLAGIGSYEEAGRYLDGRYIAEHNRRYARPAASEHDYHRRDPTARQLDEIFWLEETLWWARTGWCATRGDCCNWNGPAGPEYLRTVACWCGRMKLGR